jgi:hypothetical protein
MTNTVQLSHPDPSKKGAIIDRQKYEVVKEAIITIINKSGVITFKELIDEIEAQLTSQNFDGSPSWYCTWVKLDLESKQIIERIKGSSPQKLQLKN